MEGERVPRSTEDIAHATLLEGYEWARIVNAYHYNFGKIGRLKHVSADGIMISYCPGTSGRVEVLDVEPVRDEDVPDKVKNVHYDLGLESA